MTRLDLPEPELRSSRSLWDNTLPHLADVTAPTGAGELRVGYAEGPEGQPLRMLERTLDFGGEGRYLVAVAGDAAEIAEETSSFDNALLLTFGIMGLGLLLITTFQVRFGLAPLKRISEGARGDPLRAGRAARGRFSDRGRAAGAARPTR